MSFYIIYMIVQLVPKAWEVIYYVEDNVFKGHCYYGNIFNQRGTYPIKTCYNIFFTLVQQWVTHSIKAYSVFLKSNIGYS